MISQRGHKTSVWGDERGGMILGFGFLLPFLVALSFGAIELSTLMFDFHRANEATRRAARVAAIEEPVPDLSSFARGDVVTCQGTSGGGVSCSGASVANVATFTELMTQIQEMQPAIQPQNVILVYQDSGLGDPTTPGGILPLITVRISSLDRPMMVIGGFMGLPDSFTYPDFVTTQMANGIGTTS